MKKFQVGDEVVGTIYKLNQSTNLKYAGKVYTDYGDGSYYVTRGDEHWYVELYDQDTMEHATKLHKLLAGDDNV